ncbi:MAG: host specificity factor TipJ family phage tail protein [Desulfovibrionaceae bacterium]|nr:host specificity factor TipJ family phage tail protein [Desulfovibrionaceae bacterium]
MSEGLLRARINRAPRGGGHVWIGDLYIPRERWGGTCPTPGQVVTFRLVPQNGGGGGSGGVGLVASILSMALLPSPVQLGVWAFNTGMFSSVGAALMAGKIISMGMSLGMVMVGSMLSGSPASASNPNLAGGTTNEESPTYSISGASNRVIPFGVVPVVLGYHRITPPLGAETYTEVAGDAQYLRMLMVYGHGRLDISEHKIGETDLDDFEDVEAEHREGLEDDAPLTLYTRDVHEESLSVGLTHEAGWQLRTTQAAATEISIDISFPQGLCRIDSGGGHVSLSVAFELEYSPAGEEDWSHLCDPLTITGEQTETLLHNVNKVVAEGQYDVRIRRTTEDRDSDQDIDSAYWIVLRSFKDTPPIAYRHPLAKTALRIRATDQSNGVIDDFSALCKSYAWDWDKATETWIYRTTNNPASMFRLVLTGTGNARPQTLSQVDLDALAEWHEFCEDNGLTYNRIHDNAQSVYQTLVDIAAAGRAWVTRPDGRWSVVIDEPRTTVVQHFTPRNSWGFKSKKKFQKPLHAFRCRFNNQDAGYEEDERMVYFDGYDEESATDFETADFPGVTDSDQIWKLGRHKAACRSLRPEEYTLNADMEHIVCTMGDLVRVTHDVTMWGVASGRVKAVETAESGEYVVTVDEPCSMEAEIEYSVRFRLEDGTSLVYDVTLEVGEQTELTLTGTTEEDPAPQKGDLFMFGEKGLESQELLVAEVNPAEDMAAEIRLIDYNEAIYTASEGEIPAFTSNITRAYRRDLGLPPAPTTLAVVSDETVLSVAGDVLVPRIAMAFSLAGGFNYSGGVVQAQYRRTGAASWSSGGQVSAASERTIYLTPVNEGVTYDLRLRVVLGDGRASAWAVWPTAHTVVGKTGLPADVTGYSVQQNGALSTHRWNKVDAADIKGYELRYMSAARYFVWADATVLTSVTRGTLVTNQAIPPGEWICGIKAVDTGGRESETAATFAVKVTNDNIIIDGTEQSPGWPGTLTDCIVHEVSGYIVPEGTKTVDQYTDWDDLDVAWPDPVPEYFYEAAELDLATDEAARVWADIGGILAPGETTGVADPLLEIDYHRTGEAYDGWESWTIGAISGRYVKARVKVDTSTGVAMLLNFAPIADAQERTETHTGLTVAAGGTAFDFDVQFRDTPVVRAFLQGGGPLIAAPSGITTTGFTMDVYNPATGESIGIADVAGYEVTGV